MAFVKSSDLQIREELVYGSFFERIKDKLDIFNANSRGCINLVSTVLDPGYLSKQSFLKNFDAAFRSKRDPDSQAEKTALNVTEDNTNKVKAFGFLGPVNWNESAYILKGQSVEQTSLQIGVKAADAVLQEAVESALASLLTCLDDLPSAAKVSNTNAASLTYSGLADILAKRGDNLNDGSIWVMDSVSYYKIFKQNISSTVNDLATRVITSAQIGALGLPVLVVDSADLRTDTSNARSHDKVALLRPGAVTIELGNLRQISERKGGQENILRAWQAEWDYFVDVLGFAYSEATGDRKPSLADLRDGAKWAYKYASVKDGPGYLGTFAV